MTPTGTARITAPSATGARVLARLGWEVTTTGPTDIVIRNVLQPLAEQLRAEQPIARGLLWGNVTSALIGTLRVLQRGAVDNPATIAVVLRLLDAAPLATTAHLGASGTLDDFRRRSCCLYYRIPDGGRCGDCRVEFTDSAPGQASQVHASGMGRSPVSWCLPVFGRSQD